MTHFWAIMHLVAASFVLRWPAPEIMDPVDAVFAARELEYDELLVVVGYARLLGMPADEAWALALCRGNREEAFGG